MRCFNLTLLYKQYDDGAVLKRRKLASNFSATM